MTTATTKGYGAYGKSTQGVGAYQSAAAQPRMVQVIRLMDELLRHIEAAHKFDKDRRIAEEFQSVQAAVFILQGLSGMLNMNEGPLAESLDASYKSLVKALDGVCALIDSRDQYVRLYMASLGLRNAWASVLGINPMTAPDALSAVFASGIVNGKGEMVKG